MEPHEETKATDSKPDPLLGRTVDGYRIEEIVGRGGMGVVYKATQLSLSRPVAIKVIPREFADHPQFLERFHREVDVLSKLSHPNIVTVFERGEVDESPYLVMEYVKGTSLRDVIKGGPLPANEALVVVRSVLSALQHAHEVGIVHRDIKPENVLIAPGGIVKVADFGLSRLLGPQDATRLTHTHLALGTFEYMSPEQRERAKEADERSDLYATGVVLYEMIAGELPIGHFDPLSKKRPEECDRRIDEVVEKSLNKSPEQRYQRASEMGDAVSRLLTQVPLEERKVAPPPLPALAAVPVQRKKKAAAAEKEERDALSTAITNPASMGGILAGIWMLVMMAAFGVGLDERSWILLAAGCTCITFLTMARWGRSKRHRLFGPLLLITVGAGLGVHYIERSRSWRPAWRGQSHSFSLGKTMSPVSRTLLDKVSKRQDVRQWVSEVTGVPQHALPRRMDLSIRNGQVMMRLDDSYELLHDGNIRAAFAHAIAEATGGALYERQKGTQEVEDAMKANPPPTARKKG